MTPLLVVIAGPTAVGKTQLCVQVAQHFNTEIISADSRQFYKELAIGTAKPTFQEMQNVKHHFVNFLSIQQNYNVNEFEKEALVVLNKLFKQHQIVILTGGSGLFIDALCDGFDDDLPGADEQLRAELETLYQKYGIEILQKKLNQLDPKFYQKIDLNNIKRLTRAIEVCMITGKPYSELRKGTKQNRPFNLLKIALNRNREELFERINLRVEKMIQEGLLNEVKSVLVDKDKNALKTVGYSELFDFLEDKCTFEQAITNIKINTRRYAKKQINWFSKDTDYQWFHPDEINEIINLITITIN
ncbi:MAG: tRNA (adenosine(37)-N6)-dimethylallyltransferase MiaA [Flavobacteriales bacterium CG_4_10_14_0_2_um_filter_32_8]|nr:MAG: tRNA (adenosine(37)-N6)-dimethylallyltransferase MiaA [Flavobacteriales bacterium CG_4_10_14_0_2_um_filter_32_8]